MRQRQQRIKAPAKITTPVVSRVYLRKRLFKLLNDAIKYKSVWINGPPGAGKTTLVNSYIDKKKTPCLWYQVDSGDKDPATLFHYLSLAVKSQQKNSKLKDLPHFTSEYQGGLSTFTRNFFHELFTQIPPHSVIVFDNFQEGAFLSSPSQSFTSGGQGTKLIPPPLTGGGEGECEQQGLSGVPPGVLDSQREIKIPPFVQGGGWGGVFS
ncbi:MAG: hypothetical protein HZA08_09645 [Nitrospirae bacterium]|nr:hypothetical protein [Nitrospirota bacterium]